jgi:hypothetical protein
MGWGASRNTTDLGFGVENATTGEVLATSVTQVSETYTGLHVLTFVASQLVTSTYTVYFDGVEAATGSLGSESLPSIEMGLGVAAGGLVSTTGIVDEVRYAATAESAVQIAADTATLQPGFYSVGAVQLGACN